MHGMDMIWLEVAKVIEGYTVTIGCAVLGRFRSTYFMRSGNGTRRLDLLVDQTDTSALNAAWRRFRAEAVQEHQKRRNLLHDRVAAGRHSDPSAGLHCHAPVLTWCDPMQRREMEEAV